MSISILPARLANQIAAGEVVERPASVVKELVENAIDAGATKINIDIEKGGSKRIRIIDNGHGIKKDELTLALSRHATSKIKNLDDLESINSLGFRGEALASISSVSRLTLTSKPAEQDSAWQAIALGRDMQVEVKPAAHPNGTCIDVEDLFFNTPARRKFLRTEKTEFSHIDEVVKRIALSNLSLSFTLNHNGKTVRQYRAAKTDKQIEKRIAAICSQGFVDNALALSFEHHGMRLWGWIAAPSFARSQNDLCYSYVNGRMMRDKLINHAIRQAYGHLLSRDSYPAFVLYFELDFAEVDVNVHPAKHEVRFHQARLVHDFICAAIEQTLEQTLQPAVAFDSDSGEVLTPADENSSRYTYPDDTQATEVGVRDDHHGEYQPQHQRSGSSASTLDSAHHANSGVYAGDYDRGYVKPLRQHDNDDFGQQHNNVDSATSGASYGRQQATHYAPNYAANRPSSQELNNYQQLLKTCDDVEISAPENDNSARATSTNSADIAVAQSQANIQVYKQVSDYVFVADVEQRFCLVNLQPLQILHFQRQLQSQYPQGLVSQPLLLPVSVAMTTDLCQFVKQHQQAMLHIGVHLDVNRDKVIIRQYPAQLRQQDVAESFCLLADLLHGLEQANGSLVDSDWYGVVAQVKAAQAFTAQMAQQLLLAAQQWQNFDLSAHLLLNSQQLDLTSQIEQLLD
ncbi:DNA mismatch repair endonuclease MutL [Thalassotalea maritima]|uniref:DNA mismatch repair endonuclease MutL n=1 Tax=Thalassotalea maritima TaxID=3242416 RepID=UPI0035291D97